MMRSKYTLALAALLSVSCNAFTIQPQVARQPTALFANLRDDNHPFEETEIKFTTAVANGYTPPHGVTFAGIRRADGGSRTSTQLGMTDRNALIPDGGLSPCVIKVVGVGGGGCNAVSIMAV